MRQQVLLDLVDVSKRFQRRVDVTALHPTSLSFGAQERVAIIGPSGSGKSTLLALMGTLERPSAGRIRIRGRDVGELPDRALAQIRANIVGFVFQSFHLLDRLTAAGNVAEALAYAGVRRQSRGQLAADALGRVGLAARADHYPSELSGGERQRVAIARAVVKEPSLLLADEPTGDLDPETGAAVVDVMLSAAARATVVIVTHSPSVAAKLDRIVTLSAGRVVKDTNGRP